VATEDHNILISRGLSTCPGDKRSEVLRVINTILHIGKAIEVSTIGLVVIDKTLNITTIPLHLTNDVDMLRDIQLLNLIEEWLDGIIKAAATAII
jgi:hypothetical protein